MPESERRIPWLSVLAVGGALAWAVSRVGHALVPFLLSFALAYVLNPMINYFETRGLRRDLTVMGFYSALAIVISVAANSLLPLVIAELSNLQEQAPIYFKNTQAMVAHAQHYVAQKLPYGRQIVEQMSLKMYAPVVDGLQRVPSYVLGIFPLLSLLFLVPFITFFVLLDGIRSIDAAIQAAPSRYVEQALHLLSEVDTSLGNYLRGIIIVALAITSASFVGLSAMGVDYALAISALSGVSSFVPYLGAIMGALVGGAVAFFQFHSLAAGFKVVILFFGIRLADEALLQPFIAKHSVHLHPLVFLLSLLLGGELFGFLGLVFAVPTACVIKALVKVAWAWYSSEEGLHTPVAFDSAVVPYT